jgi:hypothetical protein
MHIRHAYVLRTYICISRIQSPRTEVRRSPTLTQKAFFLYAKIHPRAGFKSPLFRALRPATTSPSSILPVQVSLPAVALPLLLSKSSRYAYLPFRLFYSDSLMRYIHTSAILPFSSVQVPSTYIRIRTCLLPRSPPLTSWKDLGRGRRS